MFKSAILKLTLSYLLIMMVISLFFSFALFNVSTFEINSGLRAPAIQEFFPPFNSQIINGQGIEDFLNERVQISRNRLKIKLLYYNLLIFAGGGLLSYYLARRTLQPIQEALEAQQRFSADASHELRTPLTAMKSEIEVALRAKLLSEKEARALLKSNLEEVDKLTRLSDSLLKLARYQPGLSILDLQSVDVSQLVESAWKSIAPIAKTKEINLVKDAAGKIEGDKSMLEELLIILLENAVKYSPNNSTVTVKTELAANQLQLQIKDEGIGIRASDLPHIFDRFYRADPSRSQTQGYGLGLSIAKQITHAHHGKLVAESTAGHGSAFTLTLPTIQPKSDFS